MKPEPQLLVAHPAVPPRDAWRIQVWPQYGGDRLALAFRLSGDLGRVRIPYPQAPGSADGLWHHTCFEAFVGAAGEAAYREFNFSPSGLWAAYTFRAYRERDAAAPAPQAPSLRVARGADWLGVDVEIPAAALPGLAPGAPLEIGLAAVLEAADGSLSWWALRHPAERPDFHHRAGFVLRIGAPHPHP